MDGAGPSLSPSRVPAESANESVYDWPVTPGEPAREVWYGLVTHRVRPLALWFRYTLDSETDGEQTGRLWAAVTDREGAMSVGVRTLPVTLTDATIETAPFRLSFDEETRLQTDAASGAISGESDDERDVTWDLSLVPDAAPFTPLRSEWLTSAAVSLLGTGRHWSANQTTRATGSMTVGGETVTFDDAPAHQGHTVGRDIATDWQWLHCNSFTDGELAIEALRTRGRTSICLRRGQTGDRFRLNRLHHVVGPLANETTDVAPGRWTFSGRGDGVELHATVEADTDHWQRVSYRAPDGSLRYVAHCSLSGLELSYRVAGAQGWRTVESDRARAEWAETSPPVEGHYPPFADETDD
jgi:hypothetical protein